METARILLIGGGDDTEAAVRYAFGQSAYSIDIVHAPDLDQALIAVVEERFQLCVVRASDDAPQFALRICADAKQAGVRAPIVVLMDVANPARERQLLAHGALAAMPWDGSQDAMLRNLVNLTLGLRKSEQNLRQTNDRLVSEILTLQDERERAEAVNVEYVAMAENYAIAKHELEKLNQEKNKFFSIIAHDLRSPFTALLGFSSLLAERVDVLERDKIKEFASHIHESGTRVFRLLENLLEWARLQMDRGTIEPKLFALNEATHKTLDVLGPVAKDKGIRLNERGHAPHCYADPHMIDAVIRNLVNNAIKFTPSGGSITIAYETDVANACARVTVTDTGVGMDEATTRKVFSLVDGYTSQGTDGEKGTGLGLLLCKELVERNGGAITAKSKVGKGSTFSFTLPLHAPAAASAAEAPAATKKAKAAKATKSVKSAKPAKIAKSAPPAKAPKAARG
jgi:signal transduction histidine kinase